VAPRSKPRFALSSFHHLGRITKNRYSLKNNENCLLRCSYACETTGQHQNHGTMRTCMLWIVYPQITAHCGCIIGCDLAPFGSPQSSRRCDVFEYSLDKYSSEVLHKGDCIRSHIIACRHIADCLHYSLLD
jgi:hypothetical protein